MDSALTQRKRQWAVIGAVAAVVPAGFVALIFNLQGNDIGAAFALGGIVGIGALIGFLLAEIEDAKKRQRRLRQTVTSIFLIAAVAMVVLEVFAS